MENTLAGIGSDKKKIYWTGILGWSMLAIMLTGLAIGFGLVLSEKTIPVAPKMDNATAIAICQSPYMNEGFKTTAYQAEFQMMRAKETDPLVEEIMKPIREKSDAERWDTRVAEMQKYQGGIYFNEWNKIHAKVITNMEAFRPDHPLAISDYSVGNNLRAYARQICVQTLTE